MGRPKRRRLGQNFLVDRGIAERIVAQLEDEPPRVLEIGPGRGALTGLLAQRYPRVLALELDERLLPELEARHAGDTVEVRAADALREALDPLLAAEAPWQVASNLPYSIGSAILRRLLPRHDLFRRIVVMLQQEVAARVVAEPGGRGHGLLALEREAFSTARLAFRVPPQAFRPRPKVVSAVVVIEPQPPRFEPQLIADALRVAAHALNRPRKTLLNAVRPLAELSELEAAGLDPASRPGTIPLAGWIDLARWLGSHSTGSSL